MVDMLGDGLGLRREDLLAEIAPLKAKLLAARGERDQPLVDDKVLTDWNGMAIAGLAEAGAALGDLAVVERASGSTETGSPEVAAPGGGR